MIVLEPIEWHQLERAHHARVQPWIEPRLSRRSRGERHPVDDFLFDYYSYRPGQLRRWHPGIGTALAGSPGELAHRSRDRDYRPVERGVTADPARLERHRERLHWAYQVMSRTAERTAAFGCFGLHEWAMVYRLRQDEIRHPDWPMRLSGDEIASTVDELGLRCTHVDALRFYSAAARPLNAHDLHRADQPDAEQPGCLHATMDLYKWAFLASPFLPSHLVADAFELAREVRTVDMQSSPYDFSVLGLEPIPIETPDGRRQFADRQRAIASAGRELRARLLDWYGRWVCPSSAPAGPWASIGGTDASEAPSKFEGVSHRSPR